ncbi:Hypothetical protein CINCED_3A001411 [Cinara cedri]|uniref:Amyloid-beta-like protein n=1 Tax=Cinara cedri TaxID=506608 RepID=A0A5E4NGP4_9HEMI|nr:Hypothetical protein CINCED_3A001411 [Cinara cedri]
MRNVRNDGEPCHDPEDAIHQNIMTYNTIINKYICALDACTGNRYSRACRVFCGPGRVCAYWALGNRRRCRRRRRRPCKAPLAIDFPRVAAADGGRRRTAADGGGGEIARRRAAGGGGGEITRWPVIIYRVYNAYCARVYDTTTMSGGARRNGRDKRRRGATDGPSEKTEFYRGTSAAPPERNTFHYTITPYACLRSQLIRFPLSANVDYKCCVSNKVAKSPESPCTFASENRCGRIENVTRETRRPGSPPTPRPAVTACHQHVAVAATVVRNNMIRTSFTATAAVYMNGTGTDGPAPVHFEPQVAVLCDSKSDNPYYSQYMSENGRWTSDMKRKVSCLKEKVEILDYCKKVYPKNDITNIVESSHYVKIGNWCKMGYNKCKHTDWVKPYRCLEGQFQSDALLVPENCIFDHVHNQSKCWPFDRWNQTAAQACQDRDHNLRSFAMLLPCGISLFSGVEFVCCPYKDKIQLKKTVPVAADSLLSSDQFDVEEDIDDDDDDDEDEDDDVNDDEEDDDDYDNYDDIQPSRESPATTPTSTSTTTSTTTTMATTTKKATTTTMTAPPPTTSEGAHTTPSGPIRNLPTPDTYFTHFDPRDEHKLYKEALNRLEELHREKVTKVMKDWSDLEERYQEMRSKDPHMAEEFKQRMTLRFQQTVQSLEEEGSAEKHQLFAMHQQRVNAHINHRKKEAMNCYVFALNENPPNTHKVQKCLQKLLRSLHKDRHHTIAHYRHLLASSIELAEREKSVTLEHLVDIDHMVNQSLQMLYRYPTLSRKISQLMSDYIQALRSKDDTPGSLLAMTREAEASILDKYKEEISVTQEDKSRARYPMEMKRKQPHEMIESKEAKLQVETTADFDANDNTEIQQQPQQHSARQQPGAVKPDQNAAVTAPAVAIQHHDHDSEPKISHAQVNDISHGEPTFFTRKNFHRDSRNVHLTLAFAGLSLMAAICIGIAVIRRRNARLPQNQGFIEVDQGISQEERHVANMQINGYENPTYKYFEVKDQ